MHQPLLKQLEQNERLVPGMRLVAAVSGGIDSVVLLHLLKQLALSRELILVAAHLNHKIRPESDEDALFVNRLCSRWDIPLRAECCDVPMLAEQEKLSMEMAAREARREFLLRVAKEQKADYVMLAHHRDDQAETFLLRLLRGSGLSGLAGMRSCNGSWLRPLLHISREQIAAYAQEHQLEWVEDLSNGDLRYLRNRVRHRLLPQLREYNPRLEERLDLLCRQQQVEEDYWLQVVEKILPGLIVSCEDGLRLCRSKLLELHSALLIRVLREAIRTLRSDLHGLTEKHLAAIEKLLRSEQTQASLDLPGLWVARRYDQLWLRLSGPTDGEYVLELQVPGTVLLPDGSLLKAEVHNESCGETETVVEFAADQLSFPLQVRNFLKGDRFSLSGSGGSKKLKDFFIDIKLEAEQRRRVPLVLSGDKILWVAGVRRSACAPVEKKSHEILRLEFAPQKIKG